MRAHLPLRISGLLAMAVAAAAVLPIGCGPEPIDPASGTPSRSPIPVSPTSTTAPTPTPASTSTAAPLRTVTSYVIDRSGDAVAGANLTSMLGDAVIGTAISDENGFAVIDVASGGQVTAFLDVPPRPRSSHTIAITDSEVSPLIIRMGSVFAIRDAADAMARIVVEDLAPLEEIRLQLGANSSSCGSFTSTASSSGTAVVDLMIPGYCLRPDGTGIVTVFGESLAGSPVRWGAAAEVAAGTESIVALGTSASAVLAHVAPTAGMEWARAEAIFERRGMIFGVYDAMYLASAQDGSFEGTLEPAGQPFADRFATIVEFSVGGVRQVEVRRLHAPEDAFVDPDERLPYLTDIAASTSAGVISVTGTLHAGTVMADELGVLVEWKPATGSGYRHIRTAQFPVPSPGAFEIRLRPTLEGVPPPMNDEIEFVTAIVVDSSDANGYADAWRLHDLSPSLPHRERRTGSPSLFNFVWW